MNLNLMLFDGAGAQGANAPSGTPTVADAQPQEAITQLDSADKNAEFEKLIKGDYKEQFEQRIKDNLKRRFKESSSLKAKVSQSDEIINLLKMKYGITADSMDEIANAIRNDDGYLKNEAAMKGMEPETLQKLKELEFENRSMKMQMEQDAKDRQMQSTINSWINDAKELMSEHPDFDLELESQNPAFARMLRAGIDVKSAYYATHHKDILDSMVKKASMDASIKLADSIRARGMRPSENGLSGQSTAVLKTDVSKLTPKERADIARRVSEGEEISF